MENIFVMYMNAALLKNHLHFGLLEHA